MSYNLSNKEMIHEIQEVSNKVLNDWEIGFIKNLSRERRAEDITANQQTKLNEIYEKVCDSEY